MFLNHDSFGNKTAMEQEEKTWDYQHSVFYICALVTTVGYGNITPLTEAGKVRWQEHFLMTQVGLWPISTDVRPETNSSFERQMTTSSHAPIFLFFFSGF